METRFSVAIHILVMIALSKEKLTSDKIANSVNTNASYIRRIITLLKQAQILTRKKGSFDYELLKSPTSISLLEVFDAVEVSTDLDVKRNPNQACIIGKNMNQALNPIIESANELFRQFLMQYTLQNVIDNLIANIEGE